MLKEDFVFVIHPGEENREPNKKDGTTLGLQEQIRW